MLADVVVRAHEQADEDGHGALLDHYPGVFARAAGDVRQRPRGLELQSGVVIALQELDELRDHARVDDVLDRRVAL